MSFDKTSGWEDAASQDTPDGDDDKLAIEPTYDEGSVSPSASVEENEVGVIPPTKKELKESFASIADSNAKRNAERAEAAKTLKFALDTLESFDNLTDSFAASLVRQTFGNALLHCQGVGLMTYDGRRWVPKGEDKVSRAIEEILEPFSKQVAANRREFHAWVRKCLSKGGRRAIVDLVKVGVWQTTVEALNADPLLLNVANGTLNLGAGTLLPHDPDDLITQLAPVEYIPKAKCPLFEAAVLKICNYDPELVRYVQKTLGYTLTGSTREQCLFLFTGNGANGKSLLLEIIQEILGSYHRHVDSSAFLCSRSSIPSTTLAKLIGVRMLTASESNIKARWNEALLKTVTGDTRLIATFNKKEECTFTPQFKLFMVSNHEPHLEGKEHGLWRRIRLIKCKNRFWNADQGETGSAELQADKQLAEKLRTELSGILNWMIQGYCSWLKEGLSSPPCVQKDTKEYRHKNDSLSQFIEEMVEFAPQYRETKNDFYEAYKKWSLENGFVVAIKNDIGTQMNEKVNENIGLRHDKSGSTRYWAGIRLIPIESTET